MNPGSGEADYLFRGTTRGWEGNPSSTGQRLTSTSVDPLVATLFAIECRNYGAAVLLASTRGRSREVKPGLVDLAFRRIECSVTLAIRPEQFARDAEFTIEVDTCLKILSELGFPGLPVRIDGKGHLQNALKESERLGQRLTRDEVRRFTLMISGAPR